MKKITRLLSVSAFSAIVLVSAHRPSAAEEKLTWIGWVGEGAASLAYGLAESDYVLLSLACEKPGGPVLVYFPHEPEGAKDGAAYRLTLETDTRSTTIETTGKRMEMDDLFILEGELLSGEELKALLRSTGTMKISIGKDVTELPLSGSGEAAREFLAVCAP